MSGVPNPPEARSGDRLKTSTPNNPQMFTLEWSRKMENLYALVMNNPDILISGANSKIRAKATQASLFPFAVYRAPNPASTVYPCYQVRMGYLGYRNRYGSFSAIRGFTGFYQGVINAIKRGTDQVGQHGDVNSPSFFSPAKRLPSSDTATNEVIHVTDGSNVYASDSGGAKTAQFVFHIDQVNTNEVYGAIWIEAFTNETGTKTTDFKIGARLWGDFTGNGTPFENFNGNIIPLAVLKNAPDTPQTFVYEQLQSGHIALNYTPDMLTWVDTSDPGFDWTNFIWYPGDTASVSNGHSGYDLYKYVSNPGATTAPPGSSWLVIAKRGT